MKHFNLLYKLNGPLNSRTVIFIPLIFSLFFLSCQNRRIESSRSRFVIGFSQCTSDDQWRKTMNSEMQLEASLHPEVKLIIKDGRQNNKKQINDIEEFVKQKVDLLIISPNEAAPVTPAVEKAFKAGIPVILIDRKILSDSYTAFIGADNFKIGYEVGSYAGHLLKGRGQILEISGLKGSTPAIERHKGFVESISRYSAIKIIDGGDGQWLGQESMKLMKDALLRQDKIDLVYAHNDVMAYGAYKILENFGIQNKPYILGIDALSGKNGGIQMVLDRVLDATALYPTGGDYAIQVALKILKHESVDRENILETALVDYTNARILQLQMKQIQSHQQKIESQKQILDKQILKYESQQELLYIVLVCLTIVIVIVFALFIAYRLIKKINMELEEKNDAISSQKEELSAQRDQLFEMNRKVREVNEMKIQFFTNISHEFRTPLTLMIGALDQLRRLFKEDDEKQKKVRLIHRNTERLLRLVNQLMDLRKLEDGKMYLKAVKHDIVSFTGEIAGAFDVIAEKKQIDYSFNSDSQSVELWFDDEKMDKVIFNLLSNAFKFTPEGGRISVDVSAPESPDYEDLKEKMPDGYVEISISDSGIGIPVRELEKIFEPFYEIEHKGKRDFVGTGIGLTLSKSLVELHHGCIKVLSHEGAGARFSVILPLGSRHLDTNEILQEPAVPVISDHAADYGELLDNDIQIHENSRLSNSFLSDSTPLILIVEDNSDMIQYIEECLLGQYRVAKAQDGQAGYEKAANLVPDLIISDIMMPVMDGIKMVEKLKTDMRTSHIPVILLTARFTDESELEGLETGADAYITKPFNPKLLEVRIRKLIESREIIKQQFSRTEDPIIVASPDRPMDKKFMQKVIEAVEKNLLNPELSVDNLGKELGLTRVHLYRKIKSLTGVTPSEFIRLVKLRKAAELMKNTELTVSEIAFRVGFETPSYFSKCFKDHFSQTPSEFMADHLSQ